MSDKYSVERAVNELCALNPLQIGQSSSVRFARNHGWNHGFETRPSSGLKYDRWYSADARNTAGCVSRAVA